MALVDVGESVTTNILRRWDDVMRLRRGEVIWPSFCDFHTSNLCNQNCVGCAYDGTFDRKFMAENWHFRIVDELHEVGVQAYDFAGGGEPAMLPYLPRLMRHIRTLGAHHGLITNGLIMGDELTEALVQGATYVRFSLEASCREEYAAYKRIAPRQWDVVLGNIQKISNAKFAYGGQLEISLKFAVGRTLRGLEHYERAIELGRRFGAARITIKALRHKPEELPEMERIREDAILREVICREGAEDLVSRWVAPLNPATVYHCWLTPTHTVIDHLGDCYICCYYYNGRQDEMRIGNIMKQRFKTFWMGEHHRKLLGSIRHEKCLQQDCKYQKHALAIAQASNRGHVGWL